MNMHDLCRRELVSVTASASVQEAARAMRDNHVGALAVTDPFAPGRVIGMLTDRDLVIELLAEGRAPGDQPVGAICSPDLAGVRGAASVQEAVETMHTAGVRRLFVMNEDNSVAGLVSMDDLLDAIALQVEAIAGVVRSGIAREAARPRDPGVRVPEPLYIARNEP